MSVHISSNSSGAACLALSLCAVNLWPASAHAQPERAAQPARNAGKIVEEIVVTARKREENLQETPIAVSALGVDEMERLQIIDTQGLTAAVPNVYLARAVSDSATLQTFIRGVGGSGNSLLNRDVPVATYLDGTYIARATGSVVDLVDIERIEVLRGPQGTLYGRNSTGGAISYVSKRPGEEFSIKQVLGVGSH